MPRFGKSPTAVTRGSSTPVAHLLKAPRRYPCEEVTIISTMKCRKRVRQSTDTFPARPSNIYITKIISVSLNAVDTDGAYFDEFRGEVVYFRLEETEIGWGIMGRVSLANNGVRGVVESGHAAIYINQHNDPHICSQNVRMIIIVAGKMLYE
jgi:hypothetical protein